MSEIIKNDGNHEIARNNIANNPFGITEPERAALFERLLAEEHQKDYPYQGEASPCGFGLAERHAYERLVELENLPHAS